MAKIKVDIEANASNAINALDELNRSTDKSSKSSAQLRKEIDKVQSSLSKEGISNKERATALENLDKLKKQHTNSLAREQNQLYLTSDAIKGYTKMVNDLEKAYLDLMKAGNIDMAADVKSSMDEVRSQLEWIKTNNANTGVGNMSAYQAEMVALELIGDKVGLLKLKYDQLNKQLRQSIIDKGKDATETRKLAAETAKLKDELEKASKTGRGERMKNLVSSFVSAQMVVWGIRKTFTTLTSTIKESAKAASEAEETFNLFITTFEAVERSALKVASAMNNDLKMATSTAQQALGSFGDLVIGYGATDKAALEFGERAAKAAMDIVSYKNISGELSEVFSSFASGLAGNVENFRRLGYVITQAEVKTRLMKQGLGDLTGSAFQMASVQERLNTLIEKSSKAQGDMIKTLDSTENVTRRLSEAWKEWQESFGVNVNEFLTPMKKGIAELLEQTNKLNKAKAEVAKGNLDPGVYSDTNKSEDDYKQLGKEMALLQNRFSSMSSGSGLPTSQWADISLFSKEMEELVIAFSATADDLNGIFEANTLKFSKVFQNEMLRLVEPTEQARLKQREEDNIFETYNSAYQETLSNYQNFLDSLTEMTGVELDASAFNNDNLGRNEAEFNEYAERISEAYFDSLNSAMEQNLGTSWTAELEGITKGLGERGDLAFGSSEHSGALEKQIEHYKNLYDIAQNYFLLNEEYGENNERLSQREIENLNSIMDVYKQLGTEIESFDFISNSNKSVLDYESKTAGLGEVDERAEAIKAQQEAYATVIAGLNKSTFAYIEAINANESAIDGINDYFDALEYKTQSDSAQSYLSGLGGADRASAFTQAKISYGMADGDPEMVKMWQDIAKANEAYEESIKGITDQGLLDEMATALNGEIEGIKSHQKSLLDLRKKEDERKALIEEYNRQLDVANAYGDTISGGIAENNSSLGSARIDVASFGISSESIQMLQAIALAQGEYNEAIKDITDTELLNKMASDFAIGKNNIIAYYTELERLNKELANREGFADAIGSYGDVTKQNQYAMATLGMNGTEKQIFDLDQKLQEDLKLAKTASDMEVLQLAFEAATDSVYGNAAAQEEYAKKMQLQEIGKNAIGQIGTLASGDWISLLADIVSNLEIVKELATIVTDTVVPIVDTFLRPLMPLITMATGFIQQMVMGIMDFFFPIIREMAAYVALVWGTLNALGTLITDSIKWLGQTIGNFFLDIWNKLAKALDKIIPGNQKGWQVELLPVINPIENFKKNMAMVNDTVDEIRSMTMDIEQNTNPKDDGYLKALNELRAAGTIDQQQYAAWISRYSGENYDDVKSLSNGGFYQQTSDGLSIASNGIVVNINGDGKQSEIKQAILEALEEYERQKEKAGASTYGYAY